MRNTCQVSRVLTHVSGPDPLKLVGLGRFELPTRSLGNCCSIHLSYSPHGTIVILLIALRAKGKTAGGYLAGRSRFTKDRPKGVMFKGLRVRMLAARPKHNSFYQSAYLVPSRAVPCDLECTSKTFLPPHEVESGSSWTDCKFHSARPVIGSTGMRRKKRTLRSEPAPIWMGFTSESRSGGYPSLPTSTRMRLRSA